MPYRRLPNTDAARVTALEKAVSMELRQSAGEQPASFKVLTLFPYGIVSGIQPVGLLPLFHGLPGPVL